MNAEYCLFGAKAVTDLLEKLLSQDVGVRVSEDIEYVHRMRVSTRRLREALPLFSECFYSAELKKWMRAIKALTRALGEARDCDVQHNAVGRELESAALKNKPGIERLMLRLRQKRSGLQQGVVKALDRFAASATETAMLERVRVLLGQSYIEEQVNDTESGEGDKKKSDVQAVQQKVLGFVKERIAYVMGFNELVRNPQNTTQLHEIRKGLKRLRYTLELFLPLYGERLGEQIKKIKTLQDILGELHDCDVWLEWLPFFIEEEKERTLIYQGHARGVSRILRGLDFLCDTKRAMRIAHYEAFLAAWDNMCKARWWEEVLDSVANRSA